MLKSEYFVNERNILSIVLNDNIKLQINKIVFHFQKDMDNTNLLH